MSLAISRENNFDLLRLLAAFQVLFGHSIHHLNINNLIFITDYLKYFPGVLIFFTISGFLILSSFDRNKNLKKYFINRFLRLFPALWLCFIFTIILLFIFKIILVSDLFSATILKWTLAQISFFQFWTPAILRSWGVGTPNGSLWTIPVELQFYFLLPIIVLAFKQINLGFKFLLLTVVSVSFNAYISGLSESSENLITKLAEVSLLPYLYCFLTGSFIFLFWSKIRNFIEGRAIYWLVLFILFSFYSGFPPSYFPSNIQLISNFLLSILTISVAYTLPSLGKLLKGNDISYGIYIYHMIVINSFVALGYTIYLKYFLFVVIITTCLSWISWRYIEKPALSLKSKIR